MESFFKHSNVTEWICEFKGYFDPNKIAFTRFINHVINFLFLLQKTDVTCITQNLPHFSIQKQKIEIFMNNIRKLISRKHECVSFVLSNVILTATESLSNTTLLLTIEIFFNDTDVKK